jgi:hypothetical protein
MYELVGIVKFWHLNCGVSIKANSFTQNRFRDLEARYEQEQNTSTGKLRRQPENRGTSENKPTNVG